MYKRQTLYIYEPNDLVSINDLPHDSITNSNDVTIRKEVVKPLHELAKAAKEINQKTFGAVSYTHLDVYKRQG